MDLSSLNLDTLRDIMSSLSNEDMAKLNSLADELLGSGQKERPSQAFSNDFLSGINPDMIAKIMSVIGKLNSAPKDPRCDLINSLKPLLSKDKQQKADEAIKMLQLLSVLPLLGDSLQI